MAQGPPKKDFANIDGCVAHFGPQRKVELLAYRNCLATKAGLIRKLEEDMGEEIEDEIEESEKIHIQVKMKIIEVDRFMERVMK